MSEVLGTLPGAVPSTGDLEFEGAVEDGGEGEGEVARCGGSSEVERDPEDPSAATQSRSARFLARFQRLNHALCELVQDYALVSFTPLAVTVSKQPCSPHPALPTLHSPASPSLFSISLLPHAVWCVLPSLGVVLLQDKESMAKLLEVVDRSNGFISHTRHRHHHP